MIEIEVCQRQMDYRLVEGSNGETCFEASQYHAQIKDEPGFCGCGNTPDEAVGSLIANHPGQFGVIIQHLGKLPR